MAMANPRFSLTQTGSTWGWTFYAKDGHALAYCSGFDSIEDCRASVAAMQDSSKGVQITVDSAPEEVVAEPEAPDELPKKRGRPPVDKAKRK